MPAFGLFAVDSLTSEYHPNKIVSRLFCRATSCLVTQRGRKSNCSINMLLYLVAPPTHNVHSLEVFLVFLSSVHINTSTQFLPYMRHRSMTSPLDRLRYEYMKRSFLVTTIMSEQGGIYKQYIFPSPPSRKGYLPVIRRQWLAGGFKSRDFEGM